MTQSRRHVKIPLQKTYCETEFRSVFSQAYLNLHE